jgi:hypothetical protein
MLLPILLAAATAVSVPEASTHQSGTSRKVMTVRVPMPKFITEREELRFDIWKSKLFIFKFLYV